MPAYTHYELLASHLMRPKRKSEARFDNSSRNIIRT
jgi:hypothetical protein